MQQKPDVEREPHFLLVKSAEEEEPTSYYFKGWRAAAEGMAIQMAESELAVEGMDLLNDWSWLTLQWQQTAGSPTPAPKLSAIFDSEVDGFSFNALQAAVSEMDTDAVDWLVKEDLEIAWATHVGYAETNTTPQNINLQTLFNAPWELVKHTILPLPADYEFDVMSTGSSTDAFNILTNYQVLINAWGHDSDQHDLFLYILPDYPYVDVIL